MVLLHASRGNHAQPVKYNRIRGIFSHANEQSLGVGAFKLYDTHQ